MRGSDVAFERNKRGIMQAQLAEMAGTSQSYISKLEREDQILTNAMADRIRYHLAMYDSQQAVKQATMEKVEVKTDVDMVNHPPHYNMGRIEVIEYIEDKLGEGFPDYCAGNVMKYVSRYKHKNGTEDLKKAKWYLERMIQHIEEKESF